MKKILITIMTIILVCLIGCDKSKKRNENTTNEENVPTTSAIYTTNITTTTKTPTTASQVTPTSIQTTTEEFIMPDINFIVFGDSISEGYYAEGNYGWVKMMKDHYNATMADYAKAGYATKNYVSDFEEKLKAGIAEDKMNVLVIALGINDSLVIDRHNDPEKIGYQYVSLVDYVKNMSQFVATAKKYVSNIVLIGITRVDEERTNPISWSELDQSYINETIDKYDNALKSITSSKGVYYISLENSLSIENNYDGCHPNTDGHKVILNTIVSSLDVYLIEMAKRAD